MLSSVFVTPTLCLDLISVNCFLLLDWQAISMMCRFCCAGSAYGQDNYLWQWIGLVAVSCVVYVRVRTNWCRIVAYTFLSYSLEGLMQSGTLGRVVHCPSLGSCPSCKMTKLKAVIPNHTTSIHLFIQLHSDFWGPTHLSTCSGLCEFHWWILSILVFTKWSIIQGFLLFTRHSPLIIQTQFINWIKVFRFNCVHISPPRLPLNFLYTSNMIEVLPCPKNIATIGYSQLPLAHCFNSLILTSMSKTMLCAQSLSHTCNCSVLSFLHQLHVLLGWSFYITPFRVPSQATHPRRVYSHIP